jgi:hypothetical protein
MKDIERPKTMHTPHHDSKGCFLGIGIVCLLVLILLCAGCDINLFSDDNSNRETVIVETDGDGNEWIIDRSTGDRIPRAEVLNPEIPEPVSTPEPE